MGIDLGLQGLHLRPLGGPLLLIGPLELVLQLSGHGIEVPEHLLKFPVGGRGGNLIAPLAGLYPGIGVCQNLHGTCDILIILPHHDNHQRQHHQHHHADAEENPGVLRPGIEFLRGARQRQHMAIHRAGAVEVLPDGAGFLPVHRYEAVLPQPVGVPVQPYADILHPDNGGNGPENGIRIQKHDDRCIGLEIHVQQIPDHVQLPVIGQEADHGIGFPHLLHNIRQPLLELVDQIDAGGSAGQVVGADGHGILPIVDNDALIQAGPCEYPQVVIGLQVQLRPVAVRCIALVGLPDEAVVGHGFGGGNGLLQSALDLLHGLLGAEIDLLFDGLAVGPLKKGPRNHQNDHNGDQPASQDHGKQSGF